MKGQLLNKEKIIHLISCFLRIIGTVFNFASFFLLLLKVMYAVLDNNLKA